MTDELKAKLREIIRQFDYCDFELGISEDMYGDTIAQIDQAYIEAGYIAPGSAAQVQHNLQRAIGGLMTGQEWYERFERRIRPAIDAYQGRGDNSVNLALHHCLEAAKRAAGLE